MQSPNENMHVCGLVETGTHTENIHEIEFSYSRIVLFVHVVMRLRLSKEITQITKILISMLFSVYSEPLHKIRCNKPSGPYHLICLFVQ